MPHTRAIETTSTLAPAGRASSNACWSTGQAIGRPSEATTRRSTRKVPGSGGGDARRNIAPTPKTCVQSPAAIGGASGARASVACFGSSTLTRYQYKGR